MKKTYDQTTYVITHGLGDTVHFSKVDPGTTLSTGQPNVEEFSDEQVWKDRITALGGDIARLNESAARTERNSVRPTTPEAKAALIAERKASRAALRSAPASNARPKLDRLTPEQRKNQTPEQRAARRLERQTAIANFKRGVNTAPVAVEAKPKSKAKSAPVVTEPPVVEPVAVEPLAPVVEPETPQI